MNPEFFIVPLIMGYVSSIIPALKTNYVIIDCSLLAILYVLYHNINARDLKRRICTLIHRAHNKQTIVLIATERKRSIKFRAIMHHVANLTQSIYKIKEVSDCDWNDEGDQIEKLSEYLVDQSKEFILAEQIYGTITNNSKEKQRGPIGTEYVDYNTLKIYSYTLSLLELQTWVNTVVKNYKQYLKTTSNEHQLYITVSNGKKKNGESEKHGSGNGGNKNKPGNITVEAVPWESTITFANSYFHDMEAVLKKIDFFLKNKAWYLEKGIPYNLGILLYGQPGCGKTRFIKQLMNHTGRHGIDIKLNDAMDFTDLNHIIFKEEISNDYIIPQEERILIFEDIDAMGEAVKCRDLKEAETAKKKEEHLKVDTANVLADLLYNSTSPDGSTSDPLLDNRRKTSATPLANMHTVLYTNSINSINNNNNNNLSNLLNIFDGINECSGRIIIMTSNKPEVLDKALIRPGRIDIKLNFQKCTRYDVMRLINLFWNTEFTENMLLAELEMKYTSAEIYSIFRSTDDFTEIKSLFIN
jgi:hypothetical protein